MLNFHHKTFPTRTGWKCYSTLKQENILTWKYPIHFANICSIKIFPVSTLTGAEQRGREENLYFGAVDVKSDRFIALGRERRNLHKMQKWKITLFRLEYNAMQCDQNSKMECFHSSSIRNNIRWLIFRIALWSDCAVEPLKSSLSTPEQELI